jgi:hypothetical protein
METKKAKVTKITKMEKKDNYGNTSFIIEFDNGDKGYYRSKNEDQKNFIADNVSDYQIEEKTGSTGAKYFTVTVPKTDQPFSKPGFGGKPQQDPKVQMISFSMSYTKDLVVGGKLDIKDLETGFNRIYNLMISKL